MFIYDWFSNAVNSSVYVAWNERIISKDTGGAVLAWGRVARDSDRNRSRHYAEGSGILASVWTNTKRTERLTVFKKNNATVLYVSCRLLRNTQYKVFPYCNDRFASYRNRYLADDEI